MLESSIFIGDAFVQLVHELVRLGRSPPDVATISRVLAGLEAGFDELERARDRASVMLAARRAYCAAVVALHVLGAFRPPDVELQSRVLRLQRVAYRMIALAARFATPADLAMLQRLLPSEWPTELAHATA
jgi:hypothetical protein